MPSYSDRRRCKAIAGHRAGVDLSTTGVSPTCAFRGNREVPAVFHVLGDGGETLVNARMEDDLLDHRSREPAADAESRFCRRRRVERRLRSRRRSAPSRAPPRCSGVQRALKADGTLRRLIAAPGAQRNEATPSRRNRTGLPIGPNLPTEIRRQHDRAASRRSGYPQRRCRAPAPVVCRSQRLARHWALLMLTLDRGRRRSRCTSYAAGGNEA